VRKVTREREIENIEVYITYMVDRGTMPTVDDVVRALHATPDDILLAMRRLGIDVR